MNEIDQKKHIIEIITQLEKACTTYDRSFVCCVHTPGEAVENKGPILCAAYLDTKCPIPGVVEKMFYQLKESLKKGKEGKTN